MVLPGLLLPTQLQSLHWTAALPWRFCKLYGAQRLWVLEVWRLYSVVIATCVCKPWNFTLETSFTWESTRLQFFALAQLRLCMRSVNIRLSFAAWRSRIFPSRPWFWPTCPWAANVLAAQTTLAPLRARDGVARQHVDSCCKQVLQSNSIGSLYDTCKKQPTTNSKMDRQYCTDTVQLNILLQRVANATEQRVPTKNAAASRVQHCFELILVSSCLRPLVQVALPGLSHLCRRPSNMLHLPCFYSSCPLPSLPGLPSHRPGVVRRLHTHMFFFSA